MRQRQRDGTYLLKRMKVFCVFLLTALCTNRATSATTLLEGDNTLIANSLPIISCAFKWAESPDSLFIFAKFSHKLDAPAPNNVDRDSVAVDIQSDAVDISAIHPIKRFHLRVPLFRPGDPVSSTFKVNTFGGNLVLAKQDPQTEWGALLPRREPIPKQMHIWWELKQEYSTNMKELRRHGPSLKRLLSLGEDAGLGVDTPLLDETLKCESCRLTVENAIFSAESLAVMAKLPVPKTINAMNNKCKVRQLCFYFFSSACFLDSFVSLMSQGCSKPVVPAFFILSPSPPIIFNTSVPF